MSTQRLIDTDFILFRVRSTAEREAVFTNEAGSAVHLFNRWVCIGNDRFRAPSVGYIGI